MGAEVRLGRVERAILETLSRQKGLTLREDVLGEAFPAIGPKPEPSSASALRWQQRRGRAEAALSRAILSLERKNLLVRERNDRTGRTLLRSVGVTGLPDWEQIARGEEDLAAHCRKVAAAWSQLAAQATRRAATTRSERDTAGTEMERKRDLEKVARLEFLGRHR